MHFTFLTRKLPSVVLQVTESSIPANGGLTADGNPLLEAL